MKIYIVLMLGLKLILSVSSILAQEYSWLDAVQIGSEYTEHNIGSSLAVDKEGNQYLTGEFFSEMKLGSFILRSTFGDMFVAKRDPKGVWLWAVSAVSKESSWGEGIAVDDSGNVYVTGNFRNTVSFGEYVLNAYNTNTFNVFITKLNPNGKFIWARVGSGEGFDSGSGIALDTKGNVYVTGKFEETISFGNTLLVSQGDTDGFVTKLDSLGNYLWAKSFGGAGVYDLGEDICLDKDNNICLIGRFSDSVNFDKIKLISKGSYDIFSAKLDSEGNFVWAVSAGGDGPDYCKGIALDDSCNLYLCGSFFGNASFGNHKLKSNEELHVYIAKLDTTGQFLWAKSSIGTGYNEASSIAIDKKCNLYVCGRFIKQVSFGSSKLNDGSIFVCKLNDNGDILWAKQGGGNTRDECTDIGLDLSGNVYLLGNFESIAKFGNETLGKDWLFGNSIFLAKLSPHN